MRANLLPFPEPEPEVFPHKNECGASGDLVNETHTPRHPPSGAAAPGVEGLTP